jgi:threonine 3-dehydrogenase
MTEMMKAVQKVRREPGLELVEVAVPQIKPDEVLLKVEATAICGSDVHFYVWDPFAQTKLNPPITLGHEFAGEIVEVGADVKGFKVGAYVTADSHIVDPADELSRMGLQHICQGMKIFGNEVDGSFAQYVAVPETSLWRLDRSIPSEVGAIMEPLGGATQAVLIEPVTGKSVVVFGDGPIGLFAVAVARAAGARKVYLVGATEPRLELGRLVKADQTFNVRDVGDDLVSAILDDTGGLGVDVVVECSGASQAIDHAFKVVRKGGRVTLFGIHARPVEIDVNYAIILRQITVRGVAGRHMWDTWFQLEGLLASGLLDPRPVITCDLPLEGFEDGFRQMVEKECGKVILRPWDES